MRLTAALSRVVALPRGWRAGRQLARGIAAYARGDHSRALRAWSRAAAAGQAEAQYRLGLLYARGHGVLADLPDAVAWYRRAAEQGHLGAQYQLSLIYQKGPGPN